MEEGLIFGFRHKLIWIGVFLFCVVLQAQENAPIFVQASPGSFNHQALDLLFPDSAQRGKVQFCGSPQNVMKKACLEHGVAFVAIQNSCIPGHFVEATLDALCEFQIVKVIASLEMKIELALLRHRDAHEPLQRIASHPAALLQISRWKSQRGNLTEIPICEGTAEAARLLSNGNLPLDTAVIGSKNLVLLYPNLVIEEEGIQDLKENYTQFVLIEVVLRDHIVTKSEVLKEIETQIATYHQ